MDDGDGLGLTALGEEEFRGLEEAKEEEADGEHSEGDDTDRTDEVAPAVLDGPTSDEVVG